MRVEMSGVEMFLSPIARTGKGTFFLLKSYNTREHSVCGLAKLIWRASEDTKYMARKKGGTQLYGIVTALEKRPGKDIKFHIGRGCAKITLLLGPFCISKTSAKRYWGNPKMR